KAPMTSPLKRHSLLVVEDDPDTAQLLQTYFTGHQFQVEVAGRGDQAVDAARKRVPDLVLLDILLPSLDGYGVCRELRASPRTSHVPIIFLTEKSSQSDRVAGLEMGAQDYITKPFDIEELRLRVQNLIARTERENLADPRTGLPTGRMVDEQLQRQRGQAGWTVLECRLERFQPFLDVYGFVAGDDVLKFAGHLFREIVDQLGTPNDFVGHPGHDMFLVITAAASPTALAARLKERFDQEVQAHYSFMEREQGFMLIRDQRHPDSGMAQVPLMGLQITQRAA
ncbi:MAG TPA: response regulator, partial [Pseudomonas sp.]|nr:response regulator [Pseudomonas sp.]